MTEQKVIKYLTAIRDFYLHEEEEEITAINDAITALEEIQQYRAIGTPEEILRHFDSGADTLDKSKIVIDAAMKEIEEYRAIGTVEECREAVEKQRAKKPRLVGNAMICPNCPKIFKSDNVTCCPNCGQKIDWGEEEWD